VLSESPDEITTEGGLDVAGNFETVQKAVERLRNAGIFASIFLDPDEKQIEAAHNAGAQQVEFCTTEYAELTLSARATHGEGAMRAATEIRRLDAAATLAAQYGLVVAAGHGLTYRNIGALAAISEISEFNIGHSIISRSVFVGLNQAVKEMIKAIRK
jgi:pyridoxine 5-phosphate synthase